MEAVCTIQVPRTASSGDQGPQSRAQAHHGICEIGAVLKALPSTYKGVTFRSRLEARWAALFDSYQIRWAYEPEGYETPAGNYLPDFLLPDLDYLVEVKPGPDMYDERAVLSVVEQSRKKFLILDSPVVECRAYVFIEPCFFWNDMCFCSSTLIDGNSYDKLNSFYTGISGGDDPCRGHSVACKLCEIDKTVRIGEDPKFVMARNLRFNNGVAL